MNDYTTITIAGRQIDTALIDRGFVAGSSMMGCDGSCCRSGVYMDIHERERILEHRDDIKRYMDETQTKNEAQWFEVEILEDMDFASGHAVGSALHNEKCAFLTKHGRCSIQLMEQGEGLPRFSVKPFYCVLYPITIDRGVITFDDYIERRECCSMAAQAPMSVLEVCREELVYLIGQDGYNELCGVAAQRVRSIQQTA